jgi:peroxiredoxin
VSGVAATAQTTRPLLIGQTAPNATVSDLNGNAVLFSRVLAKKQTALVVFRGGWCPYCNQNLQQLRTTFVRLEELGYQVVAVSPDTPEALAAYRTESNINYALYSDQDLSLSKALGLAYRVQPHDFGGAEAFAAWQKTTPASRQKNPALPVPAVYLLTRSGVAFYQYVNLDHKVRLSGEVLLTAARVYGER